MKQHMLLTKEKVMVQTMTYKFHTQLEKTYQGMKMKTKYTLMRVGLTLFMLGTGAICLTMHASAVDSIAQPKLSFEKYLNEVGKNNLSYIAEKFNINIAEAEVISQKVLPDPEFTFEGNDEGLDIELGYTVELGNKRGARVRLARSQAEVEKLSVEYFFQELRAEATNAFLETMMHKELLDVKRSSYEYMKQLSVSDSIRFKLGEITENEARQSKVEAISLLNEMYQQEAEYKSALATLNQFMGQTVEFTNIPSGNWTHFTKDYILSALINSALDNRIDLMASIKKVETANYELKATKAERKMDVNLMVGYEREWKRGRGRIFPTEYNMLKAGFSIPLKFSNTNKGAIRAAEYSIQQKDVEHKNAQLEVQKEVAQAFYNYEASQRQVKEFEKGLLEDSQKLLDGIVYKYKRGETDILEVLIAQRTYNEIQEQYIATLKDNASALIEVQKSCGMWDIDF